MQIPGPDKKNFIIVSGLAIVACFLWSTAFVGIKTGLRHSPPLSFAGFRFMLAGLLLFPVWLKTPAPFRQFRNQMKMVAILSFFQIIMLYGLLYTSMTMVPGALAAIIIGSSPLNSAIVAHFFMSGDKMTGKKSASLILGIAGVCIISLSRQPWNSFHGLKEFLGILLLLGASFSSAFGNVIVARQKHGIHPVLLNSAQIFLGGFVLFLISLPIEGPPKLVREPEFYMALAWLSFVSATAFSLWFTLLKRPGVKVSELNLWKFVVPVSGAALSWILLPEESPRALTILGMILIAFSIILYNLSTIFRQQEKNTKVIQPTKAKTVDHPL